MLNGNGNGYSLSDIAAVQGNNDGFGGGSGAWWIIILFLFCFMGWGGNGFNGSNSGTTTREELSYGFDMADLKNSLSGVRSDLGMLNTNVIQGVGSTVDAVNNGVRSLQGDMCAMNMANLTNTNNITSAVNAGTVANMQNTFDISRQLSDMSATQAQCCCDNKMLLSQEFAQLNYNLASQNCDTRQTVTTGVRDIIDASTENTKLIMDFLTQEKIDSLTAENNHLRTQLSQSEQTAYLVQQLGGNGCSGCNGLI